MIASCAWTGLLLGFVSLFLLQSVVRERLGALAGWAFVLVMTALGAIGIYVGRFLRWNSWSVVDDPFGLFSDIWARIANPVEHPHAVALSALLSAFLLVAYL